MNKFKILICEDRPADQRNIQLYLANIKRSIPELEIVSKVVAFEETYDELTNDYDLLILDLGDDASNTNAGENILMHNKGKLNIPTLVYTGTADSFGWEFKHKKHDYPFLVEKLTKIHNSGENLITFVKGFIIVGSGIKKYNLYNPYDEVLRLSIKLIGEDSFNYILHNIFEKFGKKEITVYPMVSGLSGAVLFKLEIDSTSYILKLSKETLKLRQEHENGKNLYNQFPSHLTNHIIPEEYESFDKSVLGFLIKNVSEAQTLFDVIKNDNGEAEETHKFFYILYLENNALADFIKIKKGDTVFWPSIFAKIDDNKIFLARKSFNELKPILEKYYKNFDFEDFTRLCLFHDYGNLNQNKTLDKKYSTKMVLSHGDFHSKNILIQGGVRPVIIDTGSIQFQHWCLDYSRLIVHIFTNGIDDGTVEYFELSSLQKNIDILDSIIEGCKIELDGKNDNFISALNWLIENCKEIFGEVHKFELQLGLMKEFLQVSYRFDTMPPSKRALALISAHKCMLAANRNVLLIAK